MAKIKLKGQQEFVIIPDSQAVDLRRDFLNGSLPEVVDVAGLTFNRSALQAVILTDKEEVEEVLFTKEELQALDKELEPYRTEEELFGEKIQAVNLKNLRRFLKYKGAIVERGNYTSVVPELYSTLLDKLGAINNFRTNRRKQEVSALAHYDEIAKTMPEGYE